MTTPSDPFGGPPQEQPGQPPAPGYGQPPAGSPAYGQPPAYGPPAYGPPAGYGAPSPFGQPGGPQLASWGSRVGATLIDTLIVFGIIALAVVVGLVIGTVSETLGTLVLVLGYLAGIGFVFWQLWVQGESGQTIGKKKMGLRLLREQDGQPIGGGLSIGRYFVHFVDQIPCYVGYLWPLWDDRKQTFADKILKTVVVRA